jgi:tetratricopeptide (TPR) repeat protein
MTIESGSAATQRLQRLEGFLAVDPDNRHLLADVIELALSLGLVARAAAAADQAARVVVAGDVRLRTALGLTRLAQHRLPEAEAEFDDLLNVPAPPPEVVFLAAHAQFLQGRHEAALQRFALAPSAADADPQARLVKARCLHQLGRMEEALAEVEARLQQAPRDADALGLGAVLAYDLGQRARASDWAAQALAQSPYNLAALVTSGTLSLERGELALARQLLEQARLVRQDSGRVWLGLAILNLQELRLAEANAAIDYTVNLMPGHTGSWVARGWCRLLAGDHTGAEASFAEAIERDHNFAEAHGGLAVLHAIAGQRTAAQAALRRALGLDPACAAAQYAQALLAGDVHDLRSLQRFALRMGRSFAFDTAVPPPGASIH